MEIREESGTLVFTLRGRPVLEAPRFVQLLTPGATISGRIKRARPREGSLDLAGSLGALGRYRVRMRRTGRGARSWDGQIEVLYTGGSPIEACLRLEVVAHGGGPARWFVPGVFCGTAPRGSLTNASERGQDPRHPGDRGDVPGDRGEDPRHAGISIRADRCAWPAVLLLDPRGLAAVATRERFARGLAGVWLRPPGAGGPAAMGLEFPHRERPGSSGGSDPMTLQPGTRLAVSFRIHLGPPAPAGVRHFLRSLYERESEGNPLRPWVPAPVAADLAGLGLLRWHARPEHAALAEAVAFDPVNGVGPPEPTFRPAGFGGAGVAGLGLLLHGRSRGDDHALRAGLRILNRLAEAISPAGVPPPRWPGRHGWGPPPGATPAPVAAETALILAKALALEPDRHASWGAAIRAALDLAVSRQAPEGRFGALYDTATGEVRGSEATEGLLWAATLLEAARQAGREEYRAAARKAGEYYAPRIEVGRLWPEPAGMPRVGTRDDREGAGWGDRAEPPVCAAYRALMAYVALYEGTGDGAWLEIAQRAADWLFAFRWIYSVRFPRNTLLSAYDYRTRGTDAGPVAAGFVHHGGLFSTPALLLLWRATGDDHNWHRARDHVVSAFQFIAREDGDFGARKGMAPGRFHHADGPRPKGTVPLLSRASALGALLYAVHEIARLGIDLRLDLVG